MELAAQIKKHRARLGLSQEALAEKVYVSRQTISSWETDRTYPDVQSLLLLSTLFGVSVDDLIKGDVEAMETIIERDRKTITKLYIGESLCLVGAIASELAAFVQLVGGWGVQAIPTILLFAVLFGLSLYLRSRAMKLAKSRDLHTFFEIVSFAKSGEAGRDGALSRFARNHSMAYKAAGAVAGGIVGALLAILAAMATLNL